MEQLSVSMMGFGLGLITASLVSSNLPTANAQGSALNHLSANLPHTLEAGHWGETD